MPLAEIDDVLNEPITLLSRDSDDSEEDDDWTDIDDEIFEDMAEDRNDFHEMELENNISDPDDADHFPDDDD